MHVLAVTNAWPSPGRPAAGALIAQQIDGLRGAGIDVAILHVERLDRGMRAYAHLEGRCVAAANAHRADVVHVMYGGVMAAQVTSAITDRPAVVSFCGSDLLGEPLERIDRRVLAWGGVLASRRAARRASGIVVKSRNLRDALPPDVDRARVRVIPNGVDLEKFRQLDRAACRSALGWHPHRLHVVFPKTNGAAVKRPALARAALAHLERLGTRAELHELTGVPHEDVPVWLNASDVLLVTSAHEGSPNVVKEALACDLPVVSVDVGDVRERIGDVNGCHLADPDPVALGTKLALVASGPHRVDGRHRVRTLSVDCVSRLLMDLYAEVMERWGEARSRRNSAPGVGVVHGR